MSNQRIFILSSGSALEFFMHYSDKKELDLCNYKSRKLTSLPENHRLISAPSFAIELAQRYELTFPIHIMAQNEAMRVHNQYLKSDIMPADIPDRSFIRLNNNIYICVPELCFLQISKNISIPKLVETANNMCGKYIIDKSKPANQRKRSPVTRVNSIKKYLNNSSGAHGIKKAKRAIDYSLDNSGSPMESKLAALAVLPLLLGGFSEGQPELNGTIKLSPEAALLLGRDECSCDLVWEEEKVIVEYDSNLTHLTRDQHEYDKRKYTALTLSGYTVISVTANQLKNHRDVELLFNNIRIALNKRRRKQLYEKSENIRWETIKEIMFSPPVLS